MIRIELSDLSFQYDVHALVQAFFPGEELSFRTGENEDADAPLIRITRDESGIVCLGSHFPAGEMREHRALTGETRLEIKNAIKQALYDLLCRCCNTRLPWGSLTGIRPCKIPMKMLSEGRTGEEIASFTRDTYRTSDEKIDLACRIARLEERIIKSTHGKDGFSLYIAIPFCPTTCLYCSFTSYPIGKYKDRVDEYLDALGREMDVVAEAFSGRKPDTVYIGGGTPTTLEPAQMQRLDGMLRERFDFSGVMEYTMESGRPDSLTPEKLKTMRKLGIGRISVNPQTMHDETLTLIGRRHSVAQSIRAFEMAREAGFTNINMDIILGLPGEDERMLSETLAGIEALSPDALTVHSMAIKRAAGMHEYLLSHPEIKSVNTPEMIGMTLQSAERMGMRPYYLYRQKNMTGNFENVGYAKEGKYGIYNVLIMEEVQPVAAIGAGSISKVILEDGRIERCDTVKDITLYLSDVEGTIRKKRKFYSEMKE